MKVLILLAMLAAVIYGIGAFLGPDDLAGCDVRPSGKDRCHPADAIVAVSGGDTAARAQEAITLYQDGWAPKLVFSGAAEDTSGPSNAAVMRGIALTSGVPDEDILIEENSRTTKQNAKETKELLKSGSISSVILVTSAYHQRRAGLEFTRSFDNVYVRSHPVKQDKQWSRWWWVTPQGWYLALGELAKIIVQYAGLSR